VGLPVILYDIIWSLIAFPLAPKQMILSDREWLSYICDIDNFAHFAYESHCFYCVMYRAVFVSSN